MTAARNKRAGPVASDATTPAPFFFLLPALLLWLALSGSRSRQSGSLSSFQASPFLTLLLMLLNNGFQVAVTVPLDPF